MWENPITITCAPCCWGADDVNNPYLPPWERVLAVMGEHIRFFDACAKGVMCPIGRGNIDYPGN